MNCLFTATVMQAVRSAGMTTDEIQKMKNRIRTPIRMNIVTISVLQKRGAEFEWQRETVFLS